MKQPCRLLFVCSANLCRSVTAAWAAQRSADAAPEGALEWLFESAGTDVAPGQALPRRVASAMHEIGIPLRDEPMLISEPYARSADIILTAERRHRTFVARQFPFAVRRTFTLLEFARLLEAGREHAPDHSVGVGADLLRLAWTGRSLVQPVTDESIDIPDPVALGTSAAMFDCAATIQAAIDRIVPPA